VGIVGGEKKKMVKKRARIKAVSNRGDLKVNLEQNHGLKSM